MLIIEPAEPDAPALRPLMAARQALMQSLFPPEEDFSLDAAGMTEQQALVYQARLGAEVVGVGALVVHPGFGEIKSMYTSPAARGLGVARGVLRALEDEARQRGLPLLRLETAAVLREAVRLYAAAGFVPCDRFDPYPPCESSLFMEKPLGP